MRPSRHWARESRRRPRVNEAGAWPIGTFRSGLWLAVRSAIVGGSPVASGRMIACRPMELVVDLTDPSFPVVSHARVAGTAPAAASTPGPPVPEGRPDEGEQQEDEEEGSEEAEEPGAEARAPAVAPATDVWPDRVTAGRDDDLAGLGQPLADPGVVGTDAEEDGAADDHQRQHQAGDASSVHVIVSPCVVAII